MQAWAGWHGMSFLHRTLRWLREAHKQGGAWERGWGRCPAWGPAVVHMMCVCVSDAVGYRIMFVLMVCADRALLALQFARARCPACTAG